MSNNSKLPNLLGIHALVWVGGWSHEESRQAISQTSKAGYDIIEIPALDPSSIDIPHTRALLEEYGMKSTVSLGLSFDADINSEDPEVVEKGLKVLTDALDIVVQLGGNYLGGVVYSALGKYTQVATTKARDNVISSLKTLAQEAQKNNVIIGLEPCNRYETNICNTAEQALQIIEDIGEPNVKVHLDVYHMNIEENNLIDPVLACAAADKLGYVHIGANHRGPLSDKGNIDFDSFFGALEQVGYEGVITFESFSSAVVNEQLTTALAIWRNLWTDNWKLAKDARDFMDGKIRKAHGM